MLGALAAFAELAAAEPDAMSLLLLGAFGAGSAALERRKDSSVCSSGARTVATRSRPRQRPARRGRCRRPHREVIIGGIREVTAERARRGRRTSCPSSPTNSAAWAVSYPLALPRGSPHRAGAARRQRAPPRRSRTRARRIERRLPSGRSAWRASRSQEPARTDRRRDGGIVADKGLAGLRSRDRLARERLARDLLRDLSDQARRLPRRAEGRHAPGAAGRREAYAAAGPTGRAVAPA